METLRRQAALLARYGVVGVVNTLVSLAVITGLDLGLRVSPAAANAAGYAVGIVVSFLLNRRFVFRSQSPARGAGGRYLVAVAGGFALNQGVLQAALATLPAGPLGHEGAQLAGMATYTVSVFLACRFWVFAARREPAPDLRQELRSGFDLPREKPDNSR